MVTRHALRAAIAAALFAVCTLAITQVRADDPPAAQKPAAATQESAAQPAADAKAKAKTETASKPQQASQAHAANTLVVCRCGMAFAPSAQTQSYTHDGSKYLVCSEGCYKAAMSDPPKGALDTQNNVRKIIALALPSETSAQKPN